MISSLFQLISGAGTGAIIGVFLGRLSRPLLAARGEAIAGVDSRSQNPFMIFFDGRYVFVGLVAYLMFGPRIMKEIAAR